MKLNVIPVFALVFMAMPVAFARPADEQSDAVAKAGAMFQASCSACHQVPDTQFAVDRAWLKQVEDTA